MKKGGILALSSILLSILCVYRCYIQYTPNDNVIDDNYKKSIIVIDTTIENTQENTNEDLVVTNNNKMVKYDIKNKQLVKYYRITDEWEIL